MAIIRTNSQNYTDIANAIRYKKGVATQYLPSEMAEAIRTIPTGEGRCPHAYFNSEFNHIAWNESVSYTSSVITEYPE